MKKLIFIFIFALVLTFAAVCTAEVVINEIMTSNGVVTKGRHDDWVEIYNNSSKKVSLKGWYLSDEPDNPEKWAFPDKTVIKAGDYLLVYCVGNEKVSGKALYTNFKLPMSGGSLSITDSKGKTRTVTYSEQYGNISSGIAYDGKWHFLKTATPGKQNKGAYYDHRATEPVIVTTAGFYSKSVSVEIRCAEGQQIRYTTDCSTPNEKSQLYSGPIKVSKTTVIRAAAFGKNMLPSTVTGSTFFINDPTPSPVWVVSIYTDNKYFFSDDKGILVKGKGKTANYNQDWEYPAYIEMFDEKGIRRISQGVTTKVSGHSSRYLKQKSLSVYARKALGSKSFKYPIFEDRDYTKYSALLLRMTNSDYRSCRMRDCVLSEVSKGLGLYYQAGRPAIVYINGQYYGHYNIREKPNKDSIAQWEGITDQDIIDKVDILERNGMDSSCVLNGSNADWVKLMNYCRKNALNTEEKLRYVTDRVDVDSLFNYVIFNCLINNYDVGNVRYYRFPGGKWKFFLHDIEAGAMNGNIDKTISEIFKSRKAYVGLFPHTVFAALIEVPKYKDLFLKRMAEIIQSNFLYDTQVKPIYQKWIKALTPLMERQTKTFRYREFSVTEWKGNVRASMNRIRSYPLRVIDRICTKLKVGSVTKKKYFGETISLLNKHNSKS
ncbi:MAG: CotH kinase family protein [Clostridiales bacterium]|nr:CotH kinase family protein [Clostridiales bacterium]